MITETTSVASTAPAMFDPPSGRRTYYDLLMSPLEAAGLRKLRRLLIAHARGDVLEIGVGTGANLAFYDPDCRVIAIDLEQVALELARTKAEATHRPVCFIRGSGHPLCFPDMAFDTVVVTLALCSVLRPKSIMNEIRRVLKPGGQLLLMEHVLGVRSHTDVTSIDLQNEMYCRPGFVLSTLELS